MNMKHLNKIILAIAAVFALSSCDGYFDVDLKDQATLEEIFSQSTSTHKYLAHCYSFIPVDEEIVGSDGWTVGRSDESRYSWYQWVYYELYRTGSYSSATPSSATYYNYFSKFYTGINQCTIFIQNVDRDKQDSEAVRKNMSYEARFLRAFYYFCLFRQYGPVYIWGDGPANESIIPADCDRHTVKQNIDFMVTELDKCIENLPMEIGEFESDANYRGRVTKGAAMALKARILLWAASPLYNGGASWLKGIKNIYGDEIFPSTEDPNRWEEAAKASKDIIELNKWTLCKAKSASGNAFTDGFNAYQRILFDAWNEETIWGWWKRTSSAYSYMGGAGALLGCSCPNFTDKSITWGFGGIAPSLKLVDTYAMYDSGRFPVTGYEKNNDGNDYSRPIVDAKSGYKAEGWKEGYNQPVNAPWAPAFKAHNSTVGREPRFYASILPNGYYWPDKNSPKQFTCYSGKEATAPWAASGSAVRVGYAWVRFYPINHPLKAQTDYTGLKHVYPAFRMAEVYLNYAEACNEKPNRDEAEALKYLNLVRERVGLKKIEEAYHEVIGNKALLRTLIKKEKMVEFAMENMRHYDACRWLDAEKEYPCDNWTLKCTSENYEDSYQRVFDEFIGGPAKFEKRDYFFPVYSGDLAKMPNWTQNYGF